MTKTQILAAARRWWGKNVQLREHTNRPDAAAKEQIRQKLAGLRADRDRLKEEIKAAGEDHKALVAAARFAVDVDGDEPSWTQLREAVAKAERVAEAREELRAAEKAISNASSVLLCHRFELTQDQAVAGFPMRHHLADADTLEELAAKVTEGK